MGADPFSLVGGNGRDVRREKSNSGIDGQRKKTGEESLKKRRTMDKKKHTCDFI